MDGSIRRRHDTDGCACLRCRGLDIGVSRRTLVGSLRWSGRLVREHPSVLAVFVIPAVAQLVMRPAPPPIRELGPAIGLAGLVVGRAYLAVVAGSVLYGDDPRPVDAFRAAVARLPALFAALLAAGAVVAGALLIPVVAHETLVVLGVRPPEALVDAVIPVLLLAFLALFVKLCLVPEAAVVGRYGPFASVRASWAITSFHPRKATVLVLGLLALAAISVGLDTSVGEPDGVVTFAVTHDEAEVGLVSIGTTDETGVVGVLGGAVASALYYGVFVHLYVAGALEG